MLGIVGERACESLLPTVLNSSALLCRFELKLLVARSCRGAVEVRGLYSTMDKELFRGGNGCWLRRGVLP